MSQADSSSVRVLATDVRSGSIIGSVPDSGKLWVRVISTEKGFDSLERPWTILYNEAGTSPFQSFAWQRAWWRRYAEPDPRMRLMILVVYRKATDEESAVTAIAPFFADCRRAVGVLPMTRIGLIGRGKSDYLDLLVQPTAASASLGVLAEHVRHFRNSFDVLLLQDVPDHSPFFSSFVEALSRSGFSVTRSVENYCMRMTFGQTWEQTEQALPPASKGKNIRRKMNKLVKRHEAELEVVRDRSQLDQDLADLFALHQYRWTHAGWPGDFGAAVDVEFVSEAACGIAANGELVLAFLRVDGQRLAGICGFRHRDEFCSYVAGLGDVSGSGVANCSPGIILNLMLMRALFDDGVRVYDQLRGTEGYKAHLGGVAVPTWRVAAFGRPVGLGRGVYLVDEIHTSVRRRFKYERMQLQALRAKPGCEVADVWWHIARRLRANLAEATGRVFRRG